MHGPSFPKHSPNSQPPTRYVCSTAPTTFSNAAAARLFTSSIAGGEILRRAPEIFDEWIALLWVVAAHGNASLVAFVRSSPGFIRLLNADTNRAAAIELSRRVLALTKEIAAVDGEAALACFRSSARALRSVSIEQFEAWARRGLTSGRS